LVCVHLIGVELHIFLNALGNEKHVLTLEQSIFELFINFVFLNLLKGRFQRSFLFDSLEVINQMLQMGNYVCAEFPDRNFGCTNNLNVFSGIAFCNCGGEGYDFEPNTEDSDHKVYREID